MNKYPPEYFGFKEGDAFILDVKQHLWHPDALDRIEGKLDELFVPVLRHHRAAFTRYQVLVGLGVNWFLHLFIDTKPVAVPLSEEEWIPVVVDRMDEFCLTVESTLSAVRTIYSPRKTNAELVGQFVSSCEQQLDRLG